MRKTESKIYRFPAKQKTADSKKKMSLLQRLVSFDLYDFCDSVIYALLAVTVVFLLFFRVYSVDGSSMAPTLHDRDKLFVSSIGYNPKKDDVIVIGKTPSFSDSIVKRIIAVGGEKVYINFATGQVYVNDMELSEYYINNVTTRQYDVAFPVTVPKGCVFVLGDNRNDSLDSRSTLIGFVDEQHIIGKVLFRASLKGPKVE